MLHSINIEEKKQPFHKYGGPGYHISLNLQVNGFKRPGVKRSFIGSTNIPTIFDSFNISVGDETVGYLPRGRGSFFHASVIVASWVS